MRWLFFICVLVACKSGFTQQSSYSRAVDAYRNLEYDSAFLYIDEAIRFFEQQRDKDSLIFSRVQKADMIWQQEGIAPALAMLDKIVKDARRLPAYNVAKVAALNKTGQVHVHNAETRIAEKYFREALDQVPPHAAPNVVYGNLYTNIAWLYLELQDFTPALHYAEESKRMNESMFGRDARQLMGVYQTLMLIAHDAGWYTLSEEYGKELYRLAGLHLSPDHPNMGLIHNDLGTLYESMHRVDEAIFHLQKMVTIIQKDYAKTKNPQLLAIAYNNLGNLYSSMGEIQLAGEYFEKALHLHEINYGASGAGFVRPLVHLANARKELGSFDEAEALYERAYRLQKKVAADDRLNMAYVETQYGDLFYAKQQYAEAESFYKKALANDQKAGIYFTTIVEETRNTLAETYARTGRTHQALILLHEVLRRFKKKYPAGNIVIAGQYDKISQTHLLNNQPERALLYSDSTFTELLQLPQLPDSHWVQQLPYDHHIIRYLQHRSAIESALYKKTGMEEPLQQVISIADQYGTYLTKSLPALRTQSALMQLAAQHKAVYNNAIESCWELHQISNERRYLEKAFEFSERSRGLLLRLSANNILIDANRTVQNEAEEKDLFWRRRIGSLNAQYMDTDRSSDSLLYLLTTSIEAYSRFQDSLLRLGNKVLQQKYDLSPATIAKLQNRLRRENQNLVQYAVTGSWVFAFVLNGSEFVVQRMSADVLQEIEVLGDLYNMPPEKFKSTAFRLYGSLIQPVQRYLDAGKLVVVPDDKLFYLNFEILVSDREGRDFSQMHYLLDRYEISYQLTATALANRHTGPTNDKKAMLLTPVFTDAMKRAYRESIRDSSLADPQYFSLLRQPFAITAAKKIGKYIKHDLFAEEAAVETVFKQTAGRYDLLHLGTHAEVNHAAPLQSRFFLAKALPGDSADHDDGYLHAYEIYAMRLHSDLAVLTACETGIGNWSRGEGVMSLAHSFMYAGCPSVIMTLWKIDEKSSADIIADFYKNLSDGKSRSEALRLAKLQHIRSSDKSLSHPYFWAGMTLVGDTQPLFTSYSRWWYAGGLVLPAVVLIFLFFRLRSGKK